jgi:hypothetical protein
LAGNYNQNTYNSALYNAGRDERGGIIKSIIQAHTGPHIQAVVGGDPRYPASQDGVSFISDFTIIEGTVRKPPICYNFPDLRAVMRVMQVGRKDLDAFIYAQRYFDLPACVFPVAFLPDLGAFIFGLFEYDLPAYIFGELARLDLAAIIQIVQEDLGGQILGIAAPNLPASVFSQLAPNLGAMIWSPHDLPALLTPVFFNDLPGDIFGFQFSDIPATMFGQREPKLFALIKGFASATADLPAALTVRMEELLNASVTAQYPGPNDMIAAIGSGASDYAELVGLLRAREVDRYDLLATIGTEFGVEFDLNAKINFLSAITMAASINAWAEGSNDTFLPAALQPVHDVDISASIETNTNLKELGAVILALSSTHDLGAFLRAAETFVTAILTISTFNAVDLRATIGSPGCAGGSANLLLNAYAKAQHALDMGGFIQSFIEHNLAASINPDNIFYTMDTIQVNFTPSVYRPKTFLTTDTIGVTFSPFRGLNLSAYIRAGQPNESLPATINAIVPLPRVEPFISRIDAVELRFDHDQDMQELRLRMEGSLLDYFYVNGTSDAFIADGTEVWKINIRSFREIAAGLFGDFAAGRVCRLGSLEGYSTLDEAVRDCIGAVIGRQGDSDMNAYLNARGGVTSLRATLTTNDTYFDMSALVNRVYPVDFPATISGIVLPRQELPAFIFPQTVGAEHLLSGLLTGYQEDDSLYAAVSGTGGYVNLYASIPKVWKYSDFNAVLQVFSNQFGLLLNPDESDTTYVRGPLISELGISDATTEFTCSFWYRKDRGHSIGTNENLVGASTNHSAWGDGFAFYWLNSTTIRFWFNHWNTHYVNGTVDEELQYLHLVGTFDGTTLSFYINGELQGSDVPGVGIGNGDPEFNVGKASNNTPASDSFSQGHYDDVAVWSRGLSSDEVTEIYNYGLGKLDLNFAGTYYTPTDLELWWDIDETALTGSYPTIYDRSGSNHSGTFEGAPVDPDDAIVDVIPSSNNVSIDFTAGNTYYRTTTGDNGVPVNGTGDFSILCICRTGSTGFDMPVAAWNSAQTLGNDSAFRIKRHASPYHTNAAVTNDAGATSFANLIPGVTDPTGTVWYHWIFTYEASTGFIKAYNSGAFEHQATRSGTRKDWSEFYVGAGRWANGINDYWQAEIDTVAVWDTVLSVEDIDAVYNNGLSEVNLQQIGSSANLRAWYRLGESGDSPTLLQDKSGNGFHMVRIGSSTTIVTNVPN